LTLAKLGNYEVGVLLEILIARTGIHERAGGEVMTAGIVAAQFAIGGLPPSESLRTGGKSSVDSEGVQQAVRR
jgi:hypothetical protein